MLGFPASTTFRVEYADTDGQGRVFFANYFRFFDRGRFVYWERLGCSVDEIKQIEQDLVVVEVHCTYRVPASFYDMVSVGVRVTRVGRSSIRLEFTIMNDSTATLMAEGYATMVYVDLAANRSIPVPPELRARITRFEGHSLDDRGPSLATGERV